MHRPRKLLSKEYQKSPGGVTSRCRLGKSPSTGENQVDNRGRAQLFHEMIAVGALLIDAQRAEKRVDRLLMKDRTASRQRQLVATRRMVDELAHRYAAAIREYRQAVEEHLTAL